MDASSASWLLIAIALVAANLPFFNERVFALIPLKSAHKALWARLLELLVLYFVVGGIGFALESAIGNVFAQEKEFYMLTVPLFLTLAFPGFVLRYLRKRH